MADESSRASSGLTDSAIGGVGIKSGDQGESNAGDEDSSGTWAEASDDREARIDGPDTPCQSGIAGLEVAGYTGITCAPRSAGLGRDAPRVIWRDRWAGWAVVASASSIICSGLAIGFAYAMGNGGPLRVIWLIGFLLSWLTLLAAIVVATVNAARLSILAAREHAARDKDGESRQ